MVSLPRAHSLYRLWVTFPFGKGFQSDFRDPGNAIWHGTGGITNQSPYWYSVLRQQLATHVFLRCRRPRLLPPPRCPRRRRRRKQGSTPRYAVRKASAQQHAVRGRRGAAGAGCWCCCCSLRPPPPLFPAPPGSPARRRHQSDLCCGCCVVPTTVDDAGTAADAVGRRLFFLPRASCVVCCRRARRTLCSCPTDCEKSIGGVERQRRQRGDAARHGTTSVFRRFCPALRAGTSTVATVKNGSDKFRFATLEVVPVRSRSLGPWASDCNAIKRIGPLGLCCISGASLSANG